MASALRQIAGDRDDIRVRFADINEQALGDRIVVAPEMQIGKMSDGPQDSGMMTRRARGRMR